MPLPRQPSGQRPPPRPSRAPPPGAGSLDTRSLVQQIVEEQRKSKAELREALQRTEKRSSLVPVLAALLLMANIAAWVIFPPVHKSPGDIRTPAEVERDLRTIIASAAGQVEEWRRGHAGALPSSLSEAGVADSGLTYAATDSTAYEIKGESRGLRLLYQSNTLLSDFLEAGLGGRP